MPNLTNISFMYSHIPDNEEENDIFDNIGKMVKQK